MYSDLSITIRPTPLSTVTMMWSLPFLRFTRAICSALNMFLGTNLLVLGIQYPIDIMLEATAVITITFTSLESCHSSSGCTFFDRNGHWGNYKVGAFL